MRDQGEIAPRTAATAVRGRFSRAHTEHCQSRTQTRCCKWAHTRRSHTSNTAVRTSSWSSMRFVSLSCAHERVMQRVGARRAALTTPAIAEEPSAGIAVRGDGARVERSTFSNWFQHSFFGLCFLPMGRNFGLDGGARLWKSLSNKSKKT